VHNAGTLILNSVAVYGGRAAEVIDSNGGYIVCVASQIINSAGGIAADLQNGASAAPNMLADVYAVGNIVSGTAKSIIEGVQFGAVGSLTGSVLVYRSSNQLKNDSGVSGATVTAALDNLDDKTPAAPGSDGNYVLNVNGSTLTWVSV
jgi:hypothetical protein